MLPLSHPAQEHPYRMRHHGVAQSFRQARPIMRLVPEGLRMIGVERIRNRVSGASVSIGIIDTGIDLEHPDLRHVLAPGINLITPHRPPQDRHGHGTHIAGTIAATGSVALKGIAPRAVVYPIKAFDQLGGANIEHVIQGILWCIDRRIRIINMSFGMQERHKELHQAIRLATKAGIVVIASAGNDGLRDTAQYPARFGQTIGVGALTHDGALARFSNMHPTVNILAPGENIVSTWPQRQYATLSGTSMATAHVTGVVALLLEKNPKLSVRKIKHILTRSQVPTVHALWQRHRLGRIDAVRALQLLP